MVLDASATIRDNFFQANVVTGGGGFGGALLVGSNNPPLPARECRVLDNEFFANEAQNSGGGLAIDTDVRAEIVGNRFRRNWTNFGDGGGAYLGVAVSGSVVRDNWFESNVAFDKGGGLLVGGIGMDAPDILVNVVGNVFYWNEAGYSSGINRGGSGLWLGNLNATVEYNTFSRNAPAGNDDGTAIAIGIPGRFVIHRNIFTHMQKQIIVCDEAETVVEVTNNLFWDVDVAWDATCAAQIEPGTNLFADPLYCNWSTYGAPTLAVAANSPVYTDPLGPMGAVLVPGCEVTPVSKITWGRLKVRFQEDP